jgi:tetratricopeptide (TPR) repeat protein
MVRFPIRRYALIAAQVAVLVFMVPLAIRYAEYVRHHHWAGRGALDRVGYYQNILKHDPGNVDAIKMLASLYFDLKKLDESREYYRKAVEADPNDPESYYSIAVIDWTKAFQLRSQGKNTLSQDEEGSLQDPKACSELRSKSSAGIREGMDMLLEVFELNPEYKNAAFYMGMLWHEKAYIECSDRAAIRSDLKRAEQWMNTKKPTPSYDNSRKATVYIISLVTGNSLAGTAHGDFLRKRRASHTDTSYKM